MGKPMVLYDNQYHDDHHLYRRGNYADLLPILDKIFGTAIVVKKRRPLPAQELWKEARKVRTCVKITAALRRGGSNLEKGTGNRTGDLQRSHGSLRRSSSRFIEALQLLCEEENDCRPQWERNKCKD